VEFVFEPSLASAIFWLVTAAWVLERWLVGPREARRRTRRGSAEFLLILVAILAAFALNAATNAVGLGVVSGRGGEALVWAGLAVYAAGVALRYWAGLTLGKWFTRDLEVHGDHELVSHGPYAYLRHPLYSALVLATLGLGLLFRTPITAVLGALMVSAALIPRIRREERLLEAQLGSEYRGWAQGRSRVLPGLF
jgi:protein-S-isoprenylcysteine O-methyltransferase Ste14